uniref:DUF4218 domain-containing protein n=1 Tax=Fagus sylvatica TaxID=28930 RepID=A0A2N9GD45_FAGSY
MLRKRVKDMRWYRNKRVDDGISRHPTNSENWKEFDLQHPEFALEPRNVRLGLATDGFNPFGNMNNSYSMWPVILIPYNLPPWLMHAALLWTIHDYLGFVKYPDGYAANISRSVNTRNGRLSGLKSHDCHVLLQQVLPIGMREDRIVLILCKFEMFFPPAFFDVMVHIAVHLPREAILGGPVQYRWMYPNRKVKQDFYLPDSKSGESWQVVQCVQYRRVFDVPDDVEPEVIREDEIMAEHRDDDENEEHDIADDDVDPDLDYNILARIKDNQEKMKALGLKQLTSVIRKSSLLKYANAKRKRIIVEVDDDDYVPSIGGDDNDDESSSSSMHEVIEMLDSEGDSPAPHIFEGDLPVPYILEEDSLVPQIHGAVVLSTDTPSSSVVRVNFPIPNTIPLAPEEVFVRVLKPRGKGFTGAEPFGNVGSSSTG